MPIQEGLALVKCALDEFYFDPCFILPRPFQTLAPNAAERAVKSKTIFVDRETDCDVRYKEGNLEIQMWHISLMFAEYVAGILGLKAKEGHCRNHLKPCQLTRELHLKMLRRFKEDLATLIGEIDQLEKESAKWPPPGT